MRGSASLIQIVVLKEFGAAFVRSEVSRRSSWARAAKFVQLEIRGIGHFGATKLTGSPSAARRGNRICLIGRHLAAAGFTLWVGHFRKKRQLGAQYKRPRVSEGFGVTYC